MRSQLRKGVLEYSILLLLSKGELYSSDIIKKLEDADLLVVEGTLYPLLNRLKREKILSYRWEESKSGPPRKYYSITTKGKEALKSLNHSWEELVNSIKFISKK